MEARLKAQLEALADHRSLAYEARHAALTAIDPMSALAEQRTVRHGATSIEERLRHEVRMSASASAPVLPRKGSSVRSLREGGTPSWRDSLDVS